MIPIRLYRFLNKGEREKEFAELLKGCGNKVSEEGNCYYISLKGTARYCSTCKKRIKRLEGIYDEMRDNYNQYNI